MSHGMQSDPISEIGNDGPLSLIERVSLLSRVAFFQRIPTHILAAVVEHCEEFHVDAGANVLTEGESGNYLLIIADGALPVWNASATFDLGIGEVVGELAVLDPGPRNANVTALSDSRLLQLSSDVVDELLLDHPEISRSIISGVVRRLRSAMATASRVNPRDSHEATAGSTTFELGHF
jgi:CRP/FNR family transcriptional regulator, cyclic AMP receptor protein